MKNECYTYFKITGDFDPDEVSKLLALKAEKQWKIGDNRKNGTTYEFALWQIGLCNEYDIITENQMEYTIQCLLSKSDILKKIQSFYDVEFTLEVVPSLHVGETVPSLGPSKKIIKFCYETNTNLDIDLYIFDQS